MFANITLRAQYIPTNMHTASFWLGWLMINILVYCAIHSPYLQRYFTDIVTIMMLMNHFQCGG